MLALTAKPQQGLGSGPEYHQAAHKNEELLSTVQGLITLPL